MGNVEQIDIMSPDNPIDLYYVMDSRTIPFFNDDHFGIPAGF